MGRHKLKYSKLMAFRMSNDIVEFLKKLPKSQRTSFVESACRKKIKEVKEVRVNFV